MTWKNSHHLTTHFTQLAYLCFSIYIIVLFYDKFGSIAEKDALVSVSLFCLSVCILMYPCVWVQKGESWVCVIRLKHSDTVPYLPPQVRSYQPGPLLTADLCLLSKVAHLPDLTLQLHLFSQGLFCNLRHWSIIGPIIDHLIWSICRTACKIRAHCVGHWCGYLYLQNTKQVIKMHCMFSL